MGLGPIFAGQLQTIRNGYSMKKILSHPSLIYAEDLQSICEPLSELDIVYFAHVNVDEKNRFSALGMQPEFAKLYLEKGYYHYDIHMAQSPMKEQYILWDTIERSKESEELYEDFKGFSKGHTFTIIQENNGSKDCYHFASRLGNLSINNSYLQNLDFLKKFIMYFDDKVSAHKELKKAYDVKFEVSDEKGGYFTKNTPLNIDYNKFINSMALDRLYIDRQTYLTKREFECLYWFSLGKTIEEVAMILSITPRTVKAHISHIKDKLGCVNQFQLGVVFSKLKALIEIDA